MTGKKYDEGKPQLQLLPSYPLMAVAKVLGHGAAKYGRDNWRGGMDWSRLYGSSLRHIMQHMEGEDLDPETGCSHLAHAAASLLFLLEYENEGLGKDNRYNKYV